VYPVRASVTAVSPNRVSTMPNGGTAAKSTSTSGSRMAAAFGPCQASSAVASEMLRKSTSFGRRLAIHSKSFAMFAAFTTAIQRSVRR
jgi:hypothetical protein